MHASQRGTREDEEANRSGEGERQSNGAGAWMIRADQLSSLFWVQ